MSFLGQSAFLKALGWALLNSFWQFGLLWIVLLIFTRTQKKLSPQVKHGVALSLITLGFFWFAAGLSQRYLDAGNEATSSLVLNNTALSDLYLASRSFLENNIVYISFLYLLAVAALSVKFIRYFNHSQALRSEGLSKLSVELRMYVKQLVQQLNIRRNVQVWVSEYVDTPMVMGLLKPVILIPLACVNHLSITQMEAVLLHELAHIKRNDYLINLYIAMVEILFFFNPFTRMIIQTIKQERENSCDDWVLQFRFNRHQYASALLALEKNRTTYYPLTVAATGGSNRILLQRIQRIMNVKVTENKNGFRFLAYLFSIILLGTVAFLKPKNNSFGEIAINTTYSPTLSQTSPEFNGVDLVSGSTTPSESSTTPSEINVNETREADVKDEILHPEPLVDDSMLEVEDPLMVINTAFNETFAPINQLISAANVELREFSITEKPVAEIPVDAVVEQFPFVPRSSFSHYDIEDTTKPRLKIETERERTARESLEKAQRAIENLDWDKIQHLLKNNSDIEKVRKEIQHALTQLNWQKINQEVSEKINAEALGKMKASLKIEYDQAKAYRNQLQEYKIIEEQLKHQTETFKKDADIKLNEIRKQVSKRKAVVDI